MSATAGSPTFNGLTGAGSLAAYLAASDDVKQCMIRYWAYFAYGASSWAQDACTYDGDLHGGVAAPASASRAR